jgi:hypothetical protein
MDSDWANPDVIGCERSRSFVPGWMVGRNGIEDHKRSRPCPLRSFEACSNSFQVDQVGPSRDENKVSYFRRVLCRRVRVRCGVNHCECAVLLGGTAQCSREARGVGVQNIGW